MFSWIFYWLSCLTSLFSIPITSIMNILSRHYWNKFGLSWIITWNNFVYVSHPIVPKSYAWTGRIKTKCDSKLIDFTVLFYSGTTKMKLSFTPKCYIENNIETSRCRKYTKVCSISCGQSGTGIFYENHYYRNVKTGLHKSYASKCWCKCVKTWAFHS